MSQAPLGRGWRGGAPAGDGPGRLQRREALEPLRSQSALRLKCEISHFGPDTAARNRHRCRYRRLHGLLIMVFGPWRALSTSSRTAEGAPRTWPVLRAARRRCRRGAALVGAVGGERPMSSSRFRPRRRRRHVRARGSGGSCGAHDSGTGLADALVLEATVFCRGGCRASRAAWTCSRCSARYTMKPHMQLVCQGFQERMMQIFDFVGPLLRQVRRRRWPQRPARGRRWCRPVVLRTRHAMTPDALVVIEHGAAQ